MFNIKNLTKKFGETTVLDSLSYDFPQNGLVCILGASGCGKSTLVNIMAGFDSKYSGELSFCGRDITNLSTNEFCDFRRDNIGFIFQDYHLLSGFTALQNVLASVFDDETYSQAAKDILSKLGLEEKINEKVENLSGGQKQRVSIARALLKNPKVILADEPTGALDRKNSNEFMDILKGLSKEKLVVVITHDNKICDYADCILKIHNGKITQDEVVSIASGDGTKNSDIRSNKNINVKSSKDSNAKNWKDINSKTAIVNAENNAKTSEVASETATPFFSITESHTQMTEGHTQTSESHPQTSESHTQMTEGHTQVRNPSPSKLGLKFFKRDFLKFFTVGLAVALGVIAFMMSLSFSNSMAQGIVDFQDKNTAFNNAFIKYESDKTIDILKGDDRIENVFYQYKLNNVNLKFGEVSSLMPEKIPTPKATSSMSYGVMPRFGKNEIAITPSLAKKFSSAINELIGKNITLTFEEKDYVLTISGIFNAGYDDYFISSDIEKSMYETCSGEPFSISFDIKTFDDIIPTINELAKENILVKSAYSEVSNLTSTFNSVSRLFFIVSILVLVVGIFIATLLLVKLQNAKVREFGLLSSLGYRKSVLTNTVLVQNSILGLMAALINLAFVAVTVVFFSKTITFSITQIALSALFTLVLVTAIGYITSFKLLRLEPSMALRKA